MNNLELLQELDLTDDDDFLELLELELFPRVQRHLRVRENHFIKWRNDEFITRFRLSKETVQFIVDDLRDEISCIKNETTALTAEEKVLVTLRYLATGSILQVVGDFVGIDKSTASRCVYKTLICIARLREQFVKMPEGQAEVERVQEGFYTLSRFPRCIGALDCTHVRIQSPGGNNAEIYRNRKGFFSFNVQALCRYDLVIQDIVCRWPGSAHDSNIFNNCRLRARLENEEFGNSLIVADSGYGVRKYLITPLLNPQLQAENHFNESQIRTRNPIERCFGVLKRRFPVLAVGIRLHVRKVEAIVVASAVLHNIACEKGEPELVVDAEIEAAIAETNNINMEILPNLNRFNINELTRYNLIHQYFNRL